MESLGDRGISGGIFNRGRALYAVGAVGFLLLSLLFFTEFLRDHPWAFALQTLFAVLAGIALGLFFRPADKQLLSQIRIANERLNLALEASDTGIWSWDIRSGRVIWDSFSHRLFGLEPGTFGGTFDDFARLVKPEDMPGVEKKIKEALDQKIPYSAQFRLADSSAEPRVIHAQGKAHYDDRGNPVRMIGVVQNASENTRRQMKTQEMNRILEERVSERTLQVERANQELEAFAYTVSHDLRSPLRAISGFSQAIQEDYKDKLDDQGREYLDRIRRGTNRMGSLIDDILSLSRLGKSQMAPEKIDLTALAEEVGEECRMAYAEKNVKFSAEKNLSVMGDKRILRVVLTNLISNAFKFSSGGNNPRVEFGRTVENGRDVFFVRDNGVGFDMAHAQNLFGIFQRLHQANEFPGNGIGLATVRRMITRHGGEVWAESSTGKGATFYFTIDLKKQGGGA